MSLALSRFKMLDLSRQLPGPYCSMLFADLGMDVLTVYSPTDPMGMGIPLLNRNKRSLTLNLKAPEGQEIFHKLVATADVVLEGGRPGGAVKLRADYDTLRQLNPRLVYCSISGYGQSGPYRNRVGQNSFVCNPYWMQHLVRPCLFNQLGNGNKVGSPVSTFWGLPTTGAGHCP